MWEGTLNSTLSGSQISQLTQRVVPDQWGWGSVQTLPIEGQVG